MIHPQHTYTSPLELSAGYLDQQPPTCKLCKCGDNYKNVKEILKYGGYYKKSM